MDGWKAFIESLSTQGGAMLLLALLLIFFFPLLTCDSQEGWKLATFILGAIVGIVNSGIKNPNDPK